MFDFDIDSYLEEWFSDVDPAFYDDEEENEDAENE